MDYVVLAELHIAANRIIDFLALIRTHARHSLQEPGCLVFDVCQDPLDPARFMFYEVYRDEAAYKAHHQTPHYQHLREQAPSMVAQPDEELLVNRRIMQRLDRE